MEEEQFLKLGAYYELESTSPSLNNKCSKLSVSKIIKPGLSGLPLNKWYLQVKIEGKDLDEYLLFSIFKNQEYSDDFDSNNTTIKTVSAEIKITKNFICGNTGVLLLVVAKNRLFGKTLFKREILEIKHTPGEPSSKFTGTIIRKALIEELSIEVGLESIIKFGLDPSLGSDPWFDNLKIPIESTFVRIPLSTENSDEPSTKIYKSLNEIPPPSINGPLRIIASTDYFGANLLEITSWLITKEKYTINLLPYPSKYISAGLDASPNPPDGSFVLYFSHSPKIGKVLLYGTPRPSCLFEQIEKIHSNKNTGRHTGRLTGRLTDQEFYDNLIRYSSLRFMLSGFLYGKFSVEWLEERHYACFLAKLASSELFNVYLPLFTDRRYGFKNYHKFFILGITKCKDTFVACSI